MILADENINYRIIDAIEQIGIEVQPVAKSHRGIRDSRVIEISRTPPKTILTEDKDFGTWVFAHDVKDISVILLRYKFIETDKIIRILVNLLTSKKEELSGKFTVVTVDKVRIRNIQN